MKQAIIYFVFGFFFQAAAVAETLVTTDIKGKITIDVIDVEHFRHSLDCYTLGKADETHPFPPQYLDLRSTVGKNDGSTLKWKAQLQAPFSRDVRSTQLQVEKRYSEKIETVILKMTDEYNVSNATTKVTDCGHHDGVVRPTQASIEGVISIEYTVPKDVWVVTVKRKGTFLLSPNKMLPISGVLNDGYDKSIRSEDVFWVAPGSKITQKIIIPETFPGGYNLGNSEISFTPLLFDVSTNPLNNFNALRSQLNDFRNMSGQQITDEQGQEILKLILSVLSWDKVKRNSGNISCVRPLIDLSNNILDLARVGFVSPKYNEAIKAASILASYKLALDGISILSPYCLNTLGFSSETVQFLGLNQRGYWFAKGLSRLNNFSYKAFDKLYEALSEIEAKGLSYADVLLDNNISSAIQSNLDAVIAHSRFGWTPYAAALADVQRSVSKKGLLQNSGGTGEQHLSEMLTRLSKMEAEFKKRYLSRVENFAKSSNEKIYVGDDILMLRQLELGQKEIYTYLSSIPESNIPSGDGLAWLVRSALQNQISAFETPIPEIKYFENIQRAFFSMDDHKELLNTMKQCLPGGELL